MPGRIGALSGNGRDVSRVLHAQEEVPDVDMERNESVVTQIHPWIARWAGLPSRYKLLFATGIAFVICNMVLTHSPLGDHSTM